MKFNETTHKRDGRTICRFDFGNGVSQETDNPAVADIIRRTNFKENEKSDCSAVATAEDLIAALRNLPDPQPPAIRQDDVPGMCGADDGDGDDVPGRQDMSKLIKPGKWNELFDVSLYAAALAAAPDQNAKIPFLPGLYFGRGGRSLKDRLKDETTRMEAYDESLASDFTNMEMVAQACMSYLSTLGTANFLEELKSEGSGLHNVMALLMRINADKRNIMLTDAKIRGIQSHQLNIGNAQQVFVGTEKRSHGDDIRNPRKNPLTKIGVAREASNVSGDGEAQE